ncbi:MAG: proline--tRNA ligase [Helicobacteraceae bacterium]
MKFTRSFIKTQKEAPSDAVLKSHEYLVRGNFIHQVGSGLYDLTPLGKRVYDKINKIVKEEMDKAGALEVMLSFVTPAALWRASGRFGRYGKELLRFKDRKENDFVLGPTHEEMMLEFVSARAKSYKDLPLNVYQSGLKFRDEARPRFGLLRGREFTMKDAYSFHASTQDLDREFELMRQTYSKIFARLGLDFRVVDADSGAIGGSGSKEFMVLAKSGEDTIAVGSSYAANIEAAQRKPKRYEYTMQKGLLHTPGAKTIDEVCAYLGVENFKTVKAVVKLAVFDKEQKIVCFFVRGCDELEETKALNACGANELRDASAQDLSKAGLVAGFIGANDLAPCYFDAELNDGNIYVMGANRQDYHVADSLPSGAVFKDLVAVCEGDEAPDGSRLTFTRGIEVGHIFKLGTKYSAAMGATFLDEAGKPAPFIMGCYGIGISRLVAAIVEQRHDERGIIWTSATAPYVVDIIVENTKDAAQNALAQDLYTQLSERGVEVILDDRKERFGFKMKDYELIGFPYALIVGKLAAQGKVELAVRADLSTKTIDANEVRALCF